MIKRVSQVTTDYFTVTKYPGDYGFMVKTKDGYQNFWMAQGEFERFAEDLVALAKERVG